MDVIQSLLKSPLDLLFVILCAMFVIGLIGKLIIKVVDFLFIYEVDNVKFSRITDKPIKMKTIRHKEKEIKSRSLNG